MLTSYLVRESRLRISSENLVRESREGQAAKSEEIACSSLPLYPPHPPPPPFLLPFYLSHRSQMEKILERATSSTPIPIPIIQSSTSVSSSHPSSSNTPPSPSSTPSLSPSSSLKSPLPKPHIYSSSNLNKAFKSTTHALSKSISSEFIENYF